MIALDLCPVLSEVFLAEEIIEEFLSAGLFEGENTSNKDKEDNSSWEKIGLLSIIHSTFFYFWCHICEGTSVRPELFCALWGVTEVSNFEGHISGIDKNILKFNISVGNVSWVHVIKSIE